MTVVDDSDRVVVRALVNTVANATVNTVANNHVNNRGCAEAAGVGCTYIWLWVCVVLLVGWVLCCVVGLLTGWFLFSPVQLPLLDSLRFVLCRGNTTGVCFGLAVSSVSRFRGRHRLGVGYVAGAWEIDHVPVGSAPPCATRVRPDTAWCCG
jgi:hypothetical protein